MKKVLLLLFVLTIGFALSACSQSSDASEKEKPKEKKSQEELEKELDKELKKGGEPKIKKDDKIHKIGETFKAGHTNFTVNKVDRVQKGEYSEFGGAVDSKLKTIKDDEERLIIEVTIENIGKDSMQYNFLGLDLKDKKNQSVQPVFSIEEKGRILMTGTLTSGKKVTGVLSYVIPKGEQKHYTLVYNPFLADTNSSNTEERVKDDIDYLVKLD
ncbi:DUF4352 domain-containing protein [Bacillus halotolerans]|uniref:DUF4352 domain-containing protein n=1 Tax=Bacillus halotolerans TaxID=260554 RepID=UPI001BCD2A64|nr:DUF4352 domain-containing protein [Bacillus halotolerans]MCM3352610.1 DUF4352 domain-containing protein [Bacillus halotolerans]QVN28861.1 DUF4352 domain-containing protein [Bacillus halotolerans]